MLYPKKVKFRKWQRLRKNLSKPGVATRGTILSFGSYGLKAEEEKWLTSQQIEASRKALSRYTQKRGRVWIRVFPDKPITARPPEVTMGGGKGDPIGFVVPVKPGRILFEIDGLPEALAREALKKAGAKLPIKTRIITRR